MKTFTVHVPATTSNLGPAFDCIGLALDLWNSTRFSFGFDVDTIVTEGFVAPYPLPIRSNLIYRTFADCCQKFGVQVPTGVKMECVNRIPMGSGLGSSCTAVLCGILAANAYCDLSLDHATVLDLASEIEGHPDNAAPALYGGLSAVIQKSNCTLCRSFDIAPWHTAVVVPIFDFPTKKARAVLPKMIAMQDTVFNIGHAIFLMDALRCGDETLLGSAMVDQIHERYRLPLIPGANEILRSAIDAGACAAGLSGAGPGLIAYTMSSPKGIAERMKEVAERFHSCVHIFTPAISAKGAYVD